jgi:hypothetical protein
VLQHTGDWQVIDGAIVFGQKPAGFRHAAYLISQDVLSDVELEYEMRPN